MAQDPFTFFEWTESWSPPHFQAELSGGWFGLLIGIHGNTLAEAAKVALVGPWLQEPESPDDVLALAGAEYRMDRYPLETPAMYRARLLRAFSIHRFAGTAACIDGQIADAQLDGSVLFRPGHPGPPPLFTTPYWSQFWILTTETDATAITTMRRIVKKWKSVEWIFRGFVFDLDLPQQAIAENAISEEAI